MDKSHPLILTPAALASHFRASLSAEAPNDGVSREKRGRAAAVLVALLAVAGPLVVGGAGCAKSAPQAAVRVDPRPHWPLTGEVLAVDQTQKILRVRHDAVEGLMPAMTMEFPVSAGDAGLVKPGNLIRATLVKTPDGEFRLEGVFLRDKAADDTVAAVTRDLQQDTSTRGRNVYREVGEKVPDFALYDQTGHVVQMSRFRGKQIMMNFIYTRCPVATMCPLATEKMRATQRLAREAKIGNLELVSITFDPEHDTPGVLKEYAETRGIDTSNFSFLTGPDKAIKDLLSQFGVIAEFDGDLIKHTLTTLLVDENGKITYRADGSQWEPKDFVAKMRKT